MSSIIGLIISLVALLILIVPALMGIVRGARKSAFRLGWVLAFGIVIFVISGIISKALVNMDLSFLNLSVNGEAVKTLPDYITKTITASSDAAGTALADNPEIAELVVALSAAIINLVLFVVLFWLTKWLLWPIWAILARVFFKNKKIIKSQKQKLSNGAVIPERTQEVKIKKHALLGGVFGLVMGLVTLVFTFVPVSSISNALIQLEVATASVVQSDEGTASGNQNSHELLAESGSEETEEDGKGIVSNLLGDYADLIYVYQDSVAGKVMGVVGINAISNGIARSLATTTFNGEKVCALDEIQTMGKIYANVQALDGYDYQNLTQEDFSEILPVVKELSSTALSSGIVKSLYDQLVPYFIDNILNTPNYFIQLPDLGSDILNNTVRDVLVEFKTISASDIKNDILVAVDMFVDLNDANLLGDTFSGQFDIEILQTRITTELGLKLNENLFKMNTVSKLLPICLDAGIEYGCEQFDIEFVKTEQKLTDQQTKDLFGNLITDLVSILKNIDTSSKIYITSGAFESVGSVVDAVKNSGLITTETFDNILDFVSSKISDELEQIDIDAEFKDLANTLVLDIKNIPVYKTELQKFGEAYKLYVDNNVDINDPDVLVLAKIADKVKGSFLYLNNQDDILDALTNWAKDFVSQNIENFDTTAVETVMASIKDVESFESEYKGASDLIDFVMPILNNGNIEEELKSEENLKTLGKHLDTATQSGGVILSDKNCKILIKEMIKTFDLPEDFANITIDQKPIKNVIASNVDKIESYEQELTTVAKIINMSSDTTLTELGRTLDEVKNSKLLSGVIPAVVNYKIDEQTNDITDEDLIEIVSQIKSNVANISSYEQEFANLNEFANFDLDNASMTSFGTLLDGLSGSNLFGNVTNKLLSYAIKQGSGDIDTKYQNILSLIKQNVNNINPMTNGIYVAELGYVQSFVDFVNDNDDLTAQDISDYLKQNLLDENENSKSILIDNSVTKEIAKFGVSQINESLNIASLASAFDIINQTITSSSASIVEILEQLDKLGTNMTSITGTVVDDSLTKEKVANFGADIDALNNGDFDAVLNAQSFKIIGDYAVQNFNSLVQDSELASEVKNASQSVFDADHSSQTYTEIFEQYATAMFD